MSKLFTRFGRLARAVSSDYQKKRFASFKHQFAPNLSFSAAAEQFHARNQLYAYMHHFFYHHLPPQIRAHRAYFSEERRGFGEDAFHAMWYLLINEFKPTTFLEIGVFRGQVVSLWALIAKLNSLRSEIHCISPFAAAGDSVSKYENADFIDDLKKNFRHFDLPEPHFLKAFSTDIGALTYIQQRKFDCIYIDGSHDYEVVLSDYRNSVSALNRNGLLVMDDSSLYTDFSPPAFSFGGHPGPSRVAREFADNELEFLGGVGHQNIYRKP